MDAAAGRDAITSTQEGNWRAPSTDWWCWRGEVGRKYGKIHLKLAEYEQASYHMREEASPRPRVP